MDGEEIPQFFVCPISLQIMRDPVTAVTGITYDRDSIERWLFVDRNTTCPVSNQPLPADSDLTPNHTLRRLIQAWCSANAARGVDRIPTPRAPVTKAGVLKLLGDLTCPQRQRDTLRVLATLAGDSESNRRCMLQSGVPSAMVSIVVSCTRKIDQVDRVEEALRVLHRLRVPLEDFKALVEDNHDLFDSVSWVLSRGTSEAVNHAIGVLKAIFELANKKLLERLRPEFFEAVLQVLRARGPPQTTKAALKVLLNACPVGTNRTKITDAGGVAELIELELTAPDKRTTEMVMGVLDHLCACAEGRADFVGHAAGIAVVSKKILRVSPAADDLAMGILTSVCKNSGTKEVKQEMLRVGAVSKLCLVLQSNCSATVKERARRVLKMHSDAWNGSPCVPAYPLTGFS